MRTACGEIFFFLVIAACVVPESLAERVEPVSTASLTVEEAPIPSETPKPPEPVLALKEGFETLYRYKFEAEPRGSNIEHIAKLIHGTVLEPGGEWSFNAMVGPRTLERGFLAAPSLLLGEVVDSVGGGSCQASSTLYAVALLSGLEIVERRPHSRPSKYIHMGMDAAVSYPESCWKIDEQDKRICLDLVIRNSFDHRVHIHAKISQKDRTRKILRFELYGEKPFAKQELKWNWVTYKVHDFPTRYRRIKRWEDDRRTLQQAGSSGHEGALRLFRDGKDEWVNSRYQPVPEVWLVGAKYEIPEEVEEEELKPDEPVAETEE